MVDNITDPGKQPYELISVDVGHIFIHLLLCKWNKFNAPLTRMFKDLEGALTFMTPSEFSSGRISSGSYLISIATFPFPMGQ